MTKKVYFDPVGPIFGAHEELIRYPPEGYEFVVDQAMWEKHPTSSHLINELLIRFMDKLIPVHLFKAYLNRFLKRTPQGIDLIYAYNHLVFGAKPWVLWLEEVGRLAGFNIKHLRRYKGLVERVLASDYCKRIITSSELSKKTTLLNLDCSQFEQKIEIIPLAVHRKDFTKKYDNEKVKLLFVSSDRSPGSFELKGGSVVLEAFPYLSKKYHNLELVIRSDVPPEIRDKCRGHPDIKLIEVVIPWEQLEPEFKSADIFLVPGHESSWRVVLDAMSYELPVVTTDVYASSEQVEDGKTGFLVRKSEKVPYYGENLIHAFATSLRPQFEKAYRIVDPKVVQEVVDKTSILIENPELRRQMGRAGRWEVEHGKHSIEERNEKLKRIFDEATGG